MSGFTHESARSSSIEWYTPPEIFTALGIFFDLDPCSPGRGKSFVPARNYYTVADDGLTASWSGTVFCNPPYGSQTGLWLRRLAEHGDGIALVFARTDVQWFQVYGARADVICLVSSRIRFFRGDMATRGGTPGVGSMLMAFGEVSAAAVRRSGLGVCVRTVPGTLLHHS